MSTPESFNALSNDSPELDWFLRGKLPANTHKSTKKSTSPTPLDQTHDDFPHTIKRHDSCENEEMGHVLSRSMSLPAVQKKKSSFLRHLFSRRNGSASPSPSPSPSPQPRPLTSSSVTPHVQTPEDTNTLRRTRSLSGGTAAELDPKLEEFFRYYKKEGIGKLQEDNNESITSNSSVSSFVNSSNQAPSISNILKKVDTLGRPIPPHPPVSPLPSALVKNQHFERCLREQLHHTNSQQVLQQQQPSGISNKLNFLRRNRSISSEPISRPSSVASSIAQKYPHKKKAHVTIPGLEDLPKLKRVSFDFPVFYNDPPQQIPSRNPRKGEVEIIADGTIVIHKLTLAERKQLMTASAGGIVVGGTGPLKVLSKEEREAIESQHIHNDKEPNETDFFEDEANDKTFSASEKATIEDARKHSIQVAEAEAAASNRAKEAPNDLKRTITNNEDEVVVDSEATKINIDKPMLRHNQSHSSISNLSIAEIEEKVNNRNGTVPLDVLYTRCCHLREILPIPALLKQLKPGSTDPVPLLQLRNPRPSLIEVLTFSDFISIAPVLCVSLDGISLSSDMFRIILSSLVHKKELEKLTLRNTQIDELGWKLLCWFLTKNRTISRIDLTQVPSLRTNAQKPSKASASLHLSGMESDVNSRSDMNWNLFNAALISRKGIDELVLNGAKISLPQFKNLFEMGIKLSTTKLGLAYNDLSDEHVEILAKNLDLKVIGLDLAYNDLDGKLSHFVKRAEANGFEGLNLKYLSLNSTNLSSNYDEINRFVNGFTKLKEFRYIDLSNNKKMFSSLITALTQNLALFPKLAIIHLDYNDLSQNFLVAIAELIPFCPSLSRLSLVGNKVDNVSASALARAIKKSKSIISLEMDYDDVSAEIKEEITLYTVRNMQDQIYNRDHDDVVENNADLQTLNDELSHLLLTEKGKSQADLVKKFLKRASGVRKRIHDSIDELFNLRIQGKLSVEGKEALIRFCFIDSSIENGLKILHQKIPDITPDNSSTDEKNDYPTSTNNMRSTYISERGHEELLPFGISSNTGKEDDQDPEEIKADANRGRTADDSKLKEEGSVLKIGSFLKDSSIHKNLSTEHLNTLKDMSGDSYKEILLKTDNLNNVIEVLDSLKQKGIPIGDIYKKGDESSKPNSAGFLDLETMKNTESNLAGPRKIFDLHHNEEDLDNFTSESDDEHNEDTHKNSYGETVADKEELGHAFDEILDEIVKFRNT